MACHAIFGFKKGNTYKVTFATNGGYFINKYSTGKADGILLDIFKFLQRQQPTIQTLTIMYNTIKLVKREDKPTSNKSKYLNVSYEQRPFFKLFTNQIEEGKVEIESDGTISVQDYVTDIHKYPFYYIDIDNKYVVANVNNVMFQIPIDIIVFLTKDKTIELLQELKETHMQLLRSVPQGLNYKFTLKNLFTLDLEAVM